METAATTAYATERLDHLGIVAGVCQEIGLAEFLDLQAAGSRQKVSVATATLAMVLNGLGFSNRRLYLLPQFFENKPLEPLLGVPGIEAADLNDEIAWGVPWIGSMLTTLRACSRASPCAPGGHSASKNLPEYTWTRPPSP
jgi:hypothetical protein